MDRAIERINAFEYKDNFNEFVGVPAYKFNYIPILHISTGRWFTLFVTEDHRVYSSGNASFLHSEVGTNADNEVIQCRGQNIIAGSGGYGHALFLSDEGKVYSIGRNSDGQLGLLNRTSADILKLTVIPPHLFANQRIKLISAGAHHSLFVTEDDTIYSAGCNDDGEIAQPKRDRGYEGPIKVKTKGLDGSKVIDIKCGYQHTVVLCDSGVWVAGYNRKGQLGIHGDSIFELTRIDYLPPIKRISCGFYFTVLQTVDGRLFGAGENDKKQMISCETIQNITEFIDLEYKNAKYFCCSGYRLLVIDSEGTITIQRKEKGKCPTEMMKYTERNYDLQFVATEDDWFCLKLESKTLISQHFLRLLKNYQNENLTDITIFSYE